jgi:hypothetical protein
LTISAVAESFFATPQERADPPPLVADEDELRTEVFDYIEVFCIDRGANVSTLRQ